MSHVGPRGRQAWEACKTMRLLRRDQSGGSARQSCGTFSGAERQHQRQVQEKWYGAWESSRLAASAPTPP